jgi:hypothetical protein
MKQGVFFLVDVLNEIFNKKRKHNLQITFNVGVLFVVGFKTFNQSRDIRELVFNEKKVRMLQVFDDEIDGIGYQWKIRFFQMVCGDSSSFTT